MYVLTFVIICLVIFFGYHIIRYRNPYKLILVFGKKGAGKSTLMTKLSLKYAKKGRPVYCNSYVCGTHLFNVDDLGRYSFPENAVIMIDEVGMIWDNRNYKNFRTDVRDYFKLQRHHKNTVYMFSQSFDIDKKLRDLTDRMYLVTNIFNCFSVARGIQKNITISHGDRNQSGDSHLIDDLRFQSLLLFWAGSIKITYIPKYAKYFDSFDIEVLPPVSSSYVPFPDSHKVKRFRPWQPRPVAGLCWPNRPEGATDHGPFDVCEGSVDNLEDSETADSGVALLDSSNT